jgi:hypothetical protein
MASSRGEGRKAVKLLTPRQGADLMFLFGVLLSVRYGMHGNGSTAELSKAAAGVLVAVAGGVWRARLTGRDS